MTTDATIPTPQGLLERILRFAIARRWLMLALGPGFTAGFQMLEA